jgi:hypothetical protein
MELLRELLCIQRRFSCTRLVSSFYLTPLFRDLHFRKQEVTLHLRGR